MNPLRPEPSRHDLPQRPWRPYGRRRPETPQISARDAEMLRGTPAPLTILVPVTIEE